METPTREEFFGFSWPEKALFYVLIFSSIAYMLWQVAQRVKLWQQGKPVDWLPKDKKEAAQLFLANFWQAVLKQKKVRSSRPKTGAPMHLMMFYGFLTLFIGTTLLAINTYSPFKFHKGAYYLGYEFVLDFMGLVYLVGMTWAVVRGFATRGKEGDRSPLKTTPRDLGILLLLHSLGDLGFLTEAARMRLNPHDFDTSGFAGHFLAGLLPNLDLTGYKAIWWVHIVGVAAFFALLPQMRIRHILTIIVSTGASPDRPMGKLVTLSMEEVEKTEKIGADRPSDFTQWHLLSLDACMECGRCTEVCPAYGSGKSLNPKKVVQDIRGQLPGNLAIIEPVSEEALWACTTCNACVEACPAQIRHTDLIVDARRFLVAEGKLSGTGAVMLRQLGSTGHAWGQQKNTREDWMAGLDIPLCRNGVDFEYLFWVGCAGATDPAAVKTTQAVAQLLKKAGVKFACLGQEETCTGDPARRAGDEFLFQEKAGINVEAFKKYGIKKVITTCPHCLNTLRHEYKDFGIELEAYHHTQILQQLISKDKLKAKKSAQGEIVYHDPCYLARANGESEAPRAVVNGMANPDHSGVKTLCCGAGGARMWMEEEPNQRPGNVRAQELLATGAKTVGVACPFCRIMLDASVKQVTDQEIRIVDLAELLQEANS